MARRLLATVAGRRERVGTSVAGEASTDYVAGIDGNRIAVDRWGGGDRVPVVLLHGAGQTRHSWRRVAIRLADAGHRLLAADLRGHGDSDPAPDGVYRYERLVGDLDRLVEVAGGQAVVVGGSLGGKIGLAAAPSLSDRLSALVLIDAVPRSADGGIARVAALLTNHRGFASPQEAAERIAQSRGETVDAAAADRMRRNLRQRADGRWTWHYDPRFFLPEQELGILPALSYLESAARHVKAPTLLIRGAASDVVDAEGAAALARLIPQMDTRIVAGAGHLVASDKPDACVDLLIDFLGSI